MKSEDVVRRELKYWEGRKKECREKGMMFEAVFASTVVGALEFVLSGDEVPTAATRIKKLSGDAAKG